MSTNHDNKNNWSVPAFSTLTAVPKRLFVFSTSMLCCAAVARVAVWWLVRRIALVFRRLQNTPITIQRNSINTDSRRQANELRRHRILCPMHIHRSAIVSVCMHSPTLRGALPNSNDGLIHS